MPSPAQITRLYILPEIDERVDENSAYYKRNVLPVDHEWAWAICFAGFLIHFVFGISYQTLVVLLVELLWFYDTTIVMASTMFMFSVFSVGFMTILSIKVLIPRFGERGVVFTAGIIHMLGSLGMSISPTIECFIVFIIIKGLAAGAVFVPSSSLLRYYFIRRCSISQIIANFGQSVAVIIMPPIVRLIRKHYGIGGTFIIVAGLELHMTVAGLLLRPVSFYKFLPRVVDVVDKKAANVVGVAGGKDNNELPINKSIQNGSRSNNIDQDRNVDITDGTSAPSTDIIVIERDNLDNPESNKSSVDLIKSHLRYIKELQRRRYWELRLILLSTIPGSANLYLRNYIPTIMDSQSATLDQSAYLLTIAGAVDLVSRICVGLFSDLHILSSVQIIAISQVCLGIVCHSLSFFTTFNMLILYAILLGCFIGTRISLIPVVSRDIAGVKRMPQALVIISAVGALSSALMNPLLGLIAQRYKNFVNVLHISGVFFFISSLIMMGVPLVEMLCTSYPIKADKIVSVKLVTSTVARRKISKIESTTI